jgi:LuxR family quorum sensing-dependent transcriptional regulator
LADYDETLSFIASIDEAVTPEDICHRLLALSGRFGLTNVIAGTMPDSRTPPAEQPRHVLLEGWPDGWIDHYVRRNYVHIDPVIQRIRTDSNIFTWDEAPAAPEHERQAATMLGEAREFGLTGGVALPLNTIEGKIASVSFGGRHVDLSPEDLRTLSLVSIYAMGRALRLSLQRPRPSVSLSQREAETLQWVAAGKTDWEISEILSISRHTATRHVANAQAKLGAVNRTQAVAEAIRAGVVR